MEAIGRRRRRLRKLEKALGAVTEACKPALWPGVYWDVMPGMRGVSGFTSTTWPGWGGQDQGREANHIGSVYSGLLPDWYKKNNWMGHKGEKARRG